MTSVPFPPTEGSECSIMLCIPSEGVARRNRSTMTMSETDLIRVMAAQPDTNVLGDEIPTVSG